MRVQIIMFRQDDPRKCSAAKMVKFGLARGTRRAPPKSITLNPFATGFLLPLDRKANSITAVDCSWNKADDMFASDPGGIGRMLPPMLAGNPVNYARVGKLTTAEAIAGALYIMGFGQQAHAILDKFKWGHTFYELNAGPLDEYSRAAGEGDILRISSEYGLAAPPQV